ncbi:CHAT domain-containing protein [Nocardia abscessus]|uniref:CHAT domain-containing protein n=1 Tax=Nocardia abscessus TaxID=120957 RepID=UPI0018932672|nr:CHAT domain-containing protein [Nocardia abscessus]MBF6336503.1 CHAT domain-containing protein [Nocardia abscessus]
MNDDVRLVVENFEYTGDVGTLLAAGLPPPQQCPRHLLPHLARAHWHRFQAQSGFTGLVDREIAAAIAGRPGDPAVTRVTAMPQYQALEEAREQFQAYRDRESLVWLANAYTTLMNALDDERMTAALTADHARLLLVLDEHDGTDTYHEIVLNGLNWTITRTPRDDPQRARRLVDRARAQMNAGRRPGQILADYRAAAQLALRERPVWRDVALELAQYQSDLYTATGTPIHLAGALVTCRDLADALKRDFGNTATVPALGQLEQEVSGRIGPETARFLLTCHRDPDALRAQYNLVGSLRQQAVTAEVLEQRRDQAWVLAIGLPLDHDGRLDALLDLYDAHNDLWEIGGDTEAITLAYDTVTEALLTTAPDDAHRAALLHALANSATTAAMQTGSPDEAKQAVDAARAALDIPTEDRGRRALRLSTLASALIMQFELGGNPAAGQEAVTVAEEAVALTPPGDSELPLRWSTLSRAAREAARAGDHDMFVKAVDAGAAAVATIPAEDVRRIGMLYNYAAAVQTQAVATNVTDTGPFREAERAYRAALALLGLDHPDVPRIESTIADLLYRRYRQCGDLDALDDSLELAQRAVGRTPREHHWWPLRAIALARSARELAMFGGARADQLRRLAITHYRAVAAHPATSAQHRMICEQAQAAMHAETDPAVWLDTQERVIAAIPATVSRALSRSRRLAAVRQLDGLADRVVDAGVRSDQLVRALEMVEQCRGLLFGDAWGIRRGWARLRRAQPQLAEELSEVEHTLTDADARSDLTFHIEVEFGGRTSTRDRDPRPQAVEQIRQLAARRDRLLAEARAVPGFEDLLAPPNLEVLRTRIAGHAAVVVSAAGTALVVPADYSQPVEAVPLRQMTATAARAQVRRLRAALADVKDPACSFDRREQAQRDMHAVLEWLWDTTAGPVLDRVTTSRLWWCPIGITAQLPLHAAGRHRDGVGQTVFDRVVSSYTPSLTALADTVTTPRPHRTRPTALVVGVGERKGVPVLPSARAEAEAVAGLLPGSTVLIDSAADPEAIEQGLHEHTIAHFACHARAVSSAEHPDQGGLVLNDGMFVPSFIHDLRTTQAQLAFLSACDTASPDPALLDEPLNLASAFHLAGFRGVIGTLWHTADSTETAEAVYAALTAHGTQPADTAEAATALTETLRRMRNTYPAVPTRWAAHVHVGD